MGKPIKFKSVVAAWSKAFLQDLSSEDREYLESESFLMLCEYDWNAILQKFRETPDFDKEIAKLMKILSNRFDWDYETVESQKVTDVLVWYVEEVLEKEIEQFNKSSHQTSIA